MSTQALHTSVSSNDAALSVLRGILAFAILLLAWVTVNPFPSMADPALATLSDQSDVLNQFAYVALGGTVAILFLFHEPWRLRPLARPVYLAMFAWLVVTVVVSTYPPLSARRLVFALLVILLAASLPLLPVNFKRFCDILAGAVLTVLALSYVGLLLAPHLSIHQPDDLVEPLLAGNWRGVFPHKNIAGAMMVNFIFIGLFIAKTRNAAVGWTIVLGAGIFFVFCQAKASTGLLPLVLLISFVTMRVRSGLVCALLIFSLLIALNALTVGSLFSEGIRVFNKAAMSDPTFTGRTDIWQFALDNIYERLWLGHGFAAFWETPVTYFKPTSEGSQVTFASHAHSAFLDLALTVGVVGLGLAMLWTLVLPFLDLQRCKAVGADPHLTTLFLRIWVFAIYTCSFESVLFDRGGPHWFTMLIAMFGLRYLSVSRMDR